MYAIAQLFLLFSASLRPIAADAVNSVAAAFSELRA